MPKTRKTAKISPPSPTPRYTDLAQTLDRDDDDPASVSRDPSVHASTPASTIRGGIGARPKGETFDRELREDRPEDPDRKSRRRRGEVDSISPAFGLEGGYWPGASFSWCRDSYGHPATFSRRYNSHCILIDLFAEDGPAPRREVEWKRAQLEAHNAQARATIATMHARADAVALARATPDSDVNADIEEQVALGLRILRRDGGVPFSYLPIVRLPKADDREALGALLRAGGAVLDLPDRPANETWRAPGSRLPE